MFVIEQEKVACLGWPNPGLLCLVLQNDEFAFHDTATHSELRTFGPASSSAHPRVSFSGDGRWLVARRSLWDLAPTVAALVAGTSPAPDPIDRYAEGGPFLVDSLYAVSTDGRRALRCVGKDLRSPPVQQLLGLPDLEVQGVCPGPEPCHPYAAALSDRFVVWYERRLPPYKQALVYSLENGALRVALLHTSGIRAVVFSRDGRLLATAAGGTVRVWDPVSGECVRKYKGQRGNVQALAFHPSGRFLAVSCPNETIRFWDVESGRELGSFTWGVGMASRLAFSPDGSTVAAATPRAVVVWDVDV